MNFKDTGQDQQFKEIHQRIRIEETHYSARDMSGGDGENFIQVVINLRHGGEIG